MSEINSEMKDSKDMEVIPISGNAGGNTEVFPINNNSPYFIERAMVKFKEIKEQYPEAICCCPLMYDKGFYLDLKEDGEDHKIVLGLFSGDIPPSTTVPFSLIVKESFYFFETPMDAITYYEK